MKKNKIKAILTRTPGGQRILVEGSRKFLMSCLYDIEMAHETIESSNIEDEATQEKLNTKDYLNSQRKNFQHQRNGELS